jgi:sugar (pentulose or hexulose) kinase
LIDGYILSIDCGTQSIRALMFDRLGSLIGKEKVEFEPYFSIHPGWAEQNPEIYWQGACTACMGLKEKLKEKWENIIGVVVTTQRDTGINVDRDGNVLRPAITWLDQRMAKCCEPLPIYDNIAFTTVGMQRAVEITRRKSKANWIKENQPEIWNNTYKYLLLSGYFNYKLTGKFIDSTGSQIGHLPFNYKKQSWPKSNSSYRWKVFGIEREKLSELVNPGTIIGEISKETSKITGIKEGVKVIASGSDKGCETLGVGCLDLEASSISFGTTATIQTTSSHYFEPIQFMPAYPSVIPGYFNPEVEIFRGYWMISWFKKEFAEKEMNEAKNKHVPPEELLNERLGEIPPGSHGLMLQPYWGPGLKMPDAKGSIIGFGDIHTRVHIYRAIIEGINYGLIDGMEKIESKSKTRISKIMVSGGGSQSDSICQITADMFNRPVYRGQTYEASGLGAAVNGFVGIGVYNSYREAVLNMVHYSKVFEPDLDSAKVYKSLYERVYKRVYPRLSGLYKEIQSITGYPEI